MTGTDEWRNWGGNLTARPERVLRPADADQLVAQVNEARERGRRLRPVGSGHSFSAVAEPVDDQLSLGRFSGVHGVDPGRRRVRVGAGTPLSALGPALSGLGLAMENLGDIDAQTLAGATSTGTHGTGLGFGNLSTQIRAVQLVTGAGELVEIADERLAGAALGLGALGALTEITLQAQPRFVLAADDAVEPLAAVVESFVERCRTHDHVEFYWFPHTELAYAKTQTRLPGDAERHPVRPLVRRINDELLGNRVFEGLCRLGRRVPALVPTLNQVAVRGMPGRRVVDFSTRVFTTSRRVRFVEMEYAFEFERLPEVFEAYRALVRRRRDWRIEFPAEIRAAAADDLWLSPQHGRATAHIAVHRYHRNDPSDYFTEVEKVFLEHGGRPHWGKWHSLDADRLRALYPEFDRFVALRDELDPDRVFASPHLERILGA